MNSQHHLLNRRLLGFALAAILLVVAGQFPVRATPNAQLDQCQIIVSHALEVLQNTCSELDRNKACYGNNRISAELSNSTGLKFQSPGDKIPVKVIKTLITYPLDVQAGTWGVSLLKLQANLPDTMPGQNVTFLVYGDTSIENTSGDMQVFYFSSGLGQPTCTKISSDGIMVQSPNHTQVAFTANGVKVSIASTIFMRARPHQSMEIRLIEGHATVTTAQGTQVLTPGQMVSVPMGGATGLDADGAPSAPVTVANNTDDVISSEMISTIQTINPPDPTPTLKPKTGKADGKGIAANGSANANANSNGNAGGGNAGGNGNGGGNGGGNGNGGGKP